VVTYRRRRTWNEQLEGTYYVGLERTWAVLQVSVRLDDGNKVVYLQVSGPVSTV
jgi:hypothetical protein